MLEQVELADALKAEILELEAKLETTDHFALLGLPPGTDAATAKAAYSSSRAAFTPTATSGRTWAASSCASSGSSRRSRSAPGADRPAEAEAYLDAHPWLKPVQLAGAQAMQRMTWQKKDIPLPPVNLAPKREK